MLQELTTKKFTVIEFTIFFNSELAGTWEYVKSFHPISPEKSPVSINLVRKYQYYD